MQMVYVERQMLIYASLFYSFTHTTFELIQIAKRLESTFLLAS